MSEQPAIDAITAFMVVINQDGGLDVFTTSMPTVNMRRQANLADLENAAMRLTAEAGRALLTQSLSASNEVTPAQVVSEALAKRSND